MGRMGRDEIRIRGLVEISSTHRNEEGEMVSESLEGIQGYSGHSGQSVLASSVSHLWRCGELKKVRRL